MTKRIKRSSNREPSSTVWKNQANDLAEWTMAHLVNRSDVFGSYLSKSERTTGKTAITKKSLISHFILRDHFRGDDVGDLIGLHSTSIENMCRWIAVDIDQHGERDPDKENANRKFATKLYRQLKERRFTPLLMSSNGAGGYHLLVLFEAPTPSDKAYRFGRWLVRDWQCNDLDSEPETFPKQPKLSKRRRFGNWLRLPGRHHTRNFYTQVWNGTEWLKGKLAVSHLLETVPPTNPCFPVDALVYNPSGNSDGGPKRKALARYVRQRNEPAKPIDRILEKLDNVKSVGDQWSARCPSHGDYNNSLSIGESKEGKVLMYCHAGCGTEEIMEELKLPMASLFPPQRRGLRIVSRPRLFEREGKKE